MFRRLAQNLRRPGASGAHARNHFEQLEPRILFSAGGPTFLQDIVADNRGLISMEVCGELMESTLNDDSVRIFTAGNDNLFGTGDDQNVARTISYDADTGELIIEADIPAGERYGVFLDSSIIRDVNGFLLDGEFNGAGQQTGDGLSGGDTRFFTKGAPLQIARITTNFGDIDVELFTDRTPLSVANFLNYANGGRYDNTIFHRSVMDFVIQGGGYENEIGFDRIDRDPPVQNEPGISNLRGTIAFAKSPGDPNSATSEWFFNLGDNSENLDEQNGGFTVFGEISFQSGLDVMDAIAGLETVNASGVDGAFTDFPVTDPDAISGNPAAINPNVSVSVDRVAVLMDLSATPPEQIQADSHTFQSNRNVFVTVYDLGEIGRDQLDDAIDVKFDGNRVKSITIREDLPVGALGLVIGDANRVGTIKDGGDQSSVAFIFSNAPVSNIKLKGDVEGMNLNGLNLGGVPLPDDIDGDGVFTDMTSILIDQGDLSKIKVDGDLGGDVIIGGGVEKLDIRGSIADADIRIGAPEDPETMMKARITDAHNLDLDSQTPLKKLDVESWTSDDANGALNAPSIDRIQLRGAFDVDTVLTGSADPEAPTLGKLKAKGGLFGATFDITGDVDQINVKGDTANASLSASGSIAKLKFGDVLDSEFVAAGEREVDSVKLGAASGLTLDFAGQVNKVKADSMIGGSIDAVALRTLKVSDRNGEFSADVMLGGAPDVLEVARKIAVNTEITGGMWSLNGNVKQIKISDALDTEIVVNGSLDKFQSNDLTRFDLGVGVEANKISTGAWFRGDFAVGILNRLDINGDFRADITALRADRINITGDMFISNMLFTQAPDATVPYALRSLDVGGEIRDAQVRARFFVGDITARAMHNSIIGSSESIPQRDFPLPEDIDQFTSIDSVTLTGPRNDGPIFTESYIIASGIGELVLGPVEEFNSNQKYGVGANFFDSVSYVADGERIELRNNDLQRSPAPFGDFEIRVEFLPHDPFEV